MSKGHGAFVWYELMTTDTKAAEEFYDDVVGWTSQDAGMPGGSYTLFKAGDVNVAGLMTMPEGALKMNIPPAWLGYIGVDDVDAAAKKLAKLGGTVHREPEDIPSIGRFAIVTDPHGAVFALFKGDGSGEMPELAQNANGNIGWHELMAGDLATDLPFYQEMFGWAKDQTMPMGEMGDYQLFAHNGAQIGGMMTKAPETPAPYWGYYINVEALDSAVARATARGAKIIMGPMEVPGGAWVINGIDPQGAAFSLVSMKR
ncbi:VOC family protein [Pararhizobium sp. BT-229]|uniref:VOC family protein n=1 Tax=Pararhizobium sp. BT-229 TaxID=2986923 RepID=UPI0021F72936|nr:VOC family protein [Pararhizobium sp. BT-229]MCV9966500.1 VOC family protein [Pararhizobium sp. BT-229]